jgi:hypothetical protein|tara:strand:+ start:649 stop:966 length:318 start_codon:yes stop_codon:yes gene_type:complete
MKAPKRICAGQYRWHGFEIYCPEGDYVYWNISTIDGYWFGKEGYFDAHYTIDTVNTYKEAKQYVEDIINDPEYGVQYKMVMNDYYNLVPVKDKDGNYIVINGDDK